MLIALLLSSACVIAVQDFLTRSFTVLAFLILSASAVSIGMQPSQILLTNLCVLIFMLAVCVVVVAFRRQQSLFSVQPLKLIALGDILLLVLAAFCMTTIEMLWSIQIACLLGLLWFIVGKVKGCAPETYPFATLFICATAILLTSQVLN